MTTTRTRHNQKRISCGMCGTVRNERATPVICGIRNTNCTYNSKHTRTHKSTYIRINDNDDTTTSHGRIAFSIVTGERVSEMFRLYDTIITIIRHSFQWRQYSYQQQS